MEIHVLFLTSMVLDCISIVGNWWDSHLLFHFKTKINNFESWDSWIFFFFWCQLVQLPVFNSWRQLVGYVLLFLSKFVNFGSAFLGICKMYVLHRLCKRRHTNSPFWFPCILIKLLRSSSTDKWSSPLRSTFCWLLSPHILDCLSSFPVNSLKVTCKVLDSFQAYVARIYGFITFFPSSRYLHLSNEDML